MIEMTLGALIHNRYKNQTMMAESMGWPKQRLNKIINGKKKPNLDEVDAIAHALGVPFASIAEFFLQKESPFGDPLAFMPGRK